MTDWLSTLQRQLCNPGPRTTPSWAQTSDEQTKGYGGSQRSFIVGVGFYGHIKLGFICYQKINLEDNLFQWKHKEPELKMHACMCVSALSKCVYLCACVCVCMWVCTCGCAWVCKCMCAWVHCVFVCVSVCVSWEGMAEGDKSHRGQACQEGSFLKSYK